MQSSMCIRHKIYVWRHSIKLIHFFSCRSFYPFTLLILHFCFTLYWINAITKPKQFHCEVTTMLATSYICTMNDENTSEIFCGTRDKPIWIKSSLCCVCVCVCVTNLWPNTYNVAMYGNDGFPLHFGLKRRVAK